MNPKPSSSSASCHASRRASRRAVAALTVLSCSAWTAACQGGPVSDEQAQMAQRKLLMPYLQDRQVVCEELTVEISPNFHRHVSNPGVDGVRQRFERNESEARVEKVWTNLTGGEAGWFTVTIGEPADPTTVGDPVGPRTTFKVMNQFRLVVKERGPMALSATASGGWIAVQEAGGEAHEVRSFAIVDGALQR